MAGNQVIRINQAMAALSQHPELLIQQEAAMAAEADLLQQAEAAELADIQQEVVILISQD